jgi:hypothetical protein
MGERKINKAMVARSDKFLNKIPLIMANLLIYIEIGIPMDLGEIRR